MERIQARIEQLETRKEQKDKRIAYLNEKLEHLENNMQGKSIGESFKKSLDYQEIKRELNEELHGSVYLSCELNGLYYALDCILEG